jgi:hypothetical protein
VLSLESSFKDKGTKTVEPVKGVVAPRGIAANIHFVSMSFRLFVCMLWLLLSLCVMCVQNYLELSINNTIGMCCNFGAWQYRLVTNG